MRLIVFLLAITATLPLTFGTPAVGVLLWGWTSYMSPQDLLFVENVPFVFYIAIVTVLSWLFSHEPKRIPPRVLPWLVLLFLAWTTMTTVVALDPNAAWTEWSREWKTMLLAFIIMNVMNNRVRIHALVLVIALSLGYFALKGGLFVLATHGSSIVYGPEGSWIGDNNNFGLALIMAWPLMYYLFLYSASRAMRYGIAVMLALTIVAVLGTYSRGALLALGVVASYFWWKSKRKLVIGVCGAMLLAPAVLFMPAGWLDRMGTIETYQQDGSAVGRLDQWAFSLRAAKARPMFGTGFGGVQDSQVIRQYFPGERVLAPHSIWFQVLGDHGFAGLAIFIVIALTAVWTTRRIRRATRNRPDLEWARDLATMCQLSLVGYYAAGSFLSLAYYDLYWSIVALVTALDIIVMNVLRSEATAPHSRAPIIGTVHPPVPAIPVQG